MCGNSPARPDSSDLIAIIHPTQHTHASSLSRSRSPLGGRLMLSNQYGSVTTSEFSYPEENSDNSDAEEMLHVRIHKYGRPLCEQAEQVSPLSSSNPILHSYVTEGFARAMLNSRLDLGVGGDGIVGRTISITDSNHRLLGQGVIGRI